MKRTKLKWSIGLHFDHSMVEPAPGELRQEQRREYDPTFIQSTDPEYLEEVSNDSFAPYFDGIVNPKIKITTSGEEDPLINFCECLQTLIPNSTFEHRIEGSTFSEVRQNAIDEEYSDLLVIVNANNQVNTMMHLHLPNGPSASWRVTSITLPKQIPGHAKTSEHYPELIMRQFETRIGQFCSRMLRSLFPAQPEYEGRRVLTFHQQRDFIFVRHYRYIFNSREEAPLQEAGPRFTLRLLWLQEGPYDPSNGMYTFYRRQRHETSRLKWVL